MKREYNSEAIAVISYNGRFPGAESVEKFWENLAGGIESVSTFDNVEFKLEDMQHESGKRFLNADAILRNIDQFDAAFFDLSPREAEIMDPQHRLFLEICWEAMEKAGYTSQKYPGTIAVYAGANLSSYMVRNLYSNPGLVDRVGTFKTMLLNGQDFLATRVSYLMNFKGPSVNVNTLCSSSLVAVHSACQALLTYQCDLALAGGTNVQVSRNEALFYQEGGIGAADGHCRAFDADANGTVSGSGLGVVVLKRLEDALADHDHIEAVIRGTAVNNDGSEKNSYTAPNPDGQAACIADAIAMSEVDATTINLIEAHGTGTHLGDPIEIAGLTKAFRLYTDKTQYCAIGSVKTNIGHLVTAGGVASLIKVMLAMQHRQIPASLNFIKPNPKIDFASTPFFVNTQLRTWHGVDDAPLRAGVSSFGIGGTNAHVVVEEPPAPAAPSQDRGNWKLLILSAKTPTALTMQHHNLRAFIKTNHTVNAADLAYTLQVGRYDFANKEIMLFRNIAELEAQMESAAITYTEKPSTLPVVYLIPGADTAYAGIGRALYDEEPLFRQHLDECAAILLKNYNFNIKEVLFTRNREFKNEEQTICQFCVSYALVRFWHTCGVVPQQIAAYGTGLLIAAVVFGDLSLEQAFLRLFHRQDGKLPDLSLPLAELNSTGEQLDPARLQSFMNENPGRIFILAGAGKRLVAASGSGTKFLYSLAEDEQEESKTLLTSLGYYWLWNGGVDWNRYHGTNKANRIQLPTYPFERQRYWIEPGNAISTDKGVATATVPSETKLSRQPRPQLQNAYVAHRNSTEEVLVQYWQEALGIDCVGIHDDFYDLGGHSLLAAALVPRINDRFKLKLELHQLMEKSTIAELGEYIDTCQWVTGTGQNTDTVSENYEVGSL